MYVTDTNTLIYFFKGIVLYELEVGIPKSKAPRKRLQQLERKGTPIGPIDILIAGTAFAHNAILVTHNVKEFKRINKLQLEDWY